MRNLSLGRRHIFALCDRRRTSLRGYATILSSRVVKNYGNAGLTSWVHSVKGVRYILNMTHSTHIARPATIIITIRHHQAAVSVR